MTTGGVFPRRKLTDVALSMLASATRDALARRESGRARDSVRVLRSSFGESEPTMVARHAALVRMVSITEAYVDTLSMELLSAALGPPSALMAKVLEEVEISASGNWQRREKTFSSLHGISLRSGPRWTTIEAAIEARNSVAHGLGNLTTRQKRRRDIARQLGRADIVVGGGRIYLTPASLRTVADATRGFISWLDSQDPVVV